MGCRVIFEEKCMVEYLLDLHAGGMVINMSEKQNFVSSTIGDIKEFASDSRRLLTRCSKPDRKGKW